MIRWAVDGRLVVLVALLAVTIGGACGGGPVTATPIAAPSKIAELRINVYNSDRARAEREEKVNLYTIFLRQAVEREFVRAGYRVVVDPNQPYDLSAVVSLGDFPVTSDGQKYATASMTLKSRERVVDQVSAVVTLDDKSDISQPGPVALVDAVTRSARVAAFAKNVPVEARQPAVIAAPVDE